MLRSGRAQSDEKPRERPCRPAARGPGCRRRGETPAASAMNLLAAAIALPPAPAVPEPGRDSAEGRDRAPPAGRADPRAEARRPQPPGSIQPHTAQGLRRPGSSQTVSTQALGRTLPKSLPGKSKPTDSSPESEGERGNEIFWEIVQTLVQHPSVNTSRALANGLALQATVLRELHCRPPSVKRTAKRGHPIALNGLQSTPGEASGARTGKTS